MSFDEARLGSHEPRHRPQLGVRNHAPAGLVVIASGRLIAPVTNDLINDVAGGENPAVTVHDDESAHRREHLATRPPAQADEWVRELRGYVNCVREHST